MIKAVIFDLWNTLAVKNIKVEEVLSKHFGIKNCGCKDYEKAVQSNKWKTEEGMAKGFLKYFNLPLTKENIKFVVDTFDIGINRATIIPGMKDLVKKVRVNYKTGILSNTTIFESRIICCKYFLSPLFDVEVYSWQISSLKPDFKNYRFISGKLKVKPSECVFIDDTKVNVEAAKRLGMKGIHFKNLKQCKNELKKLVIKV